MSIKYTKKIRDNHIKSRFMDKMVKYMKLKFLSEKYSLILVNQFANQILYISNYIFRDIIYFK